MTRRNSTAYFLQFVVALNEVIHYFQCVLSSLTFKNPFKNTPYFITYISFSTSFQRLNIYLVVKKQNIYTCIKGPLECFCLKLKRKISVLTSIYGHTLRKTILQFWHDMKCCITTYLFELRARFSMKL